MSTKYVISSASGDASKCIQSNGQCLPFRNTALYCEANQSVGICQFSKDEKVLKYDINAQKLTGGSQDYYLVAPAAPVSASTPADASTAQPVWYMGSVAAPSACLPPAPANLWAASASQSAPTSSVAAAPSLTSTSWVVAPAIVSSSETMMDASLPAPPSLPFVAAASSSVPVSGLDVSAGLITGSN